MIEEGEDRACFPQGRSGVPEEVLSHHLVGRVGVVGDLEEGGGVDVAGVFEEDGVAAGVHGEEGCDVVDLFV